MSTLHRSRKEWQLPDPQSTLTDDQLDAMVREIQSQTTGSVGVGMMLGHIRGQGVQIKNGRERVWKSLRRVDPVGTAHRWNRVLHRREYRVAGKKLIFFTFLHISSLCF